MPSLFSRIVAGEIPCHKIAEDDRFLECLGARDKLLRRGGDLELLGARGLQRNTLAGMDACGIGTGGRHTRPLVSEKREQSLFGDGDPYPDMPALRRRVEAWLGS